MTSGCSFIESWSLAKWRWINLEKEASRVGLYDWYHRGNFVSFDGAARPIDSAVMFIICNFYYLNTSIKLRLYHTNVLLDGSSTWELRNSRALNLPRFRVCVMSSGYMA